MATSPAAHDVPLGEVAVLCASKTLDALESRNHLQHHERTHIERTHLDVLAEGRPCEIFETITQLSTISPRDIPEFIGKLGLAVSKNLRQRIILLPGLTRFAVPSHFYEDFPDLMSAARALLCPILFSEDHEAIGVGSVNPIAALETASRIASHLSHHSEVTPYLTVVRLDYDTWRTLLNRHFSL